MEENDPQESHKERSKYNELFETMKQKEREKRLSQYNKQ